VKPAVSVIVPVYNVADYLPRCLDSLLGQTLTDIEIVVVDDGSTDRSAEIIADYVRIDPRIIAIRQENEGLSGARNTGLAAASGPYIGFVDSDDWAHPDMFRILLDRMEETDADLCASDFSMAYDDRTVPGTLRCPAATISVQAYGIDTYWLEKTFSTAVWNKLYKKSILDAHGIRFESKKDIFSEDVLFNLYYLLHTRTVASVTDSLYFYYQRSGSLIHSHKPDFLKKELTLIQKFQDYYAPYPERARAEAMMAGLLFDRMLAICMGHLADGRKLGSLRSDLRYAGGYDFFSDGMRSIARNKRTWLPLRGFAFLASRKHYRLSTCYLLLYDLGARAKRRLRARLRNRGAVQDAGPAASEW